MEEEKKQGQEEQKPNNLLSYELLQKENKQLKERIDVLEKTVNEQLEDIKNCIRSGNKINGQEKIDNQEEKDRKELGKRLFDDLSKR